MIVLTHTILGTKLFMKHNKNHICCAISCAGQTLLQDWVGENSMGLERLGGACRGLERVGGVGDS